ncbi:hypothetical protein J3D55_001787 [Chryseobacterium ginsenosidimutans]|nr:hypothetical protein [Chryseobacterium ginsenosidimutans]
MKRSLYSNYFVYKAVVNSTALFFLTVVWDKNFMHLLNAMLAKFF